MKLVIRTTHSEDGDIETVVHLLNDEEWAKVKERYILLGKLTYEEKAADDTEIGRLWTEIEQIFNIRNQVSSGLPVPNGALVVMVKEDALRPNEIEFYE